MKILVVIEDDPDVRFLIETIFAMDSRFAVRSSAESAEDALEAVRTERPDIIVLDHGRGELTGIEAAQQLKVKAPQTKIILFTAHAELEARTHDEPAIDAFLLKTNTARLLPLAQELTDMLSLM